MSNDRTDLTRAIPTPLAALALGIASLGWCWDKALQLQGALQTAAALFALVCLSLLLFKFIRQPALLREDLANPILGAVLPASAMALMVIATALPSSLGRWLWSIAVVLHLWLLVAFIWHRVGTLQFNQLLPGWFVPPIGIVTAVVTCPAAVSENVIQGIFWFGLLCYAVLLPLVIIRLLFAGSVPLAARPSLAVLAAPASLCLTGYLSLTSPAQPMIVLSLLILALVMTSIIYAAMLYLLRLPFSPGFAAFTFPLVIGATALFKASEQFALWQQPESAALLQQLAYLELVIATLVTLYVSFRFAGYLWQQSAALRPDTLAKQTHRLVESASSKN
ncbi:TDT family transporter [Alishewanella sp. SMS8]|uniref:TDT family transporter n=1 Tax=unclassified Alishewanella TaxID=2628974 RepID=UPI002740AF28|nr:TDT family transporter [Alishewanella sp. SMS8]MDP5206352.1 TDT family transporter [Alishewanella sp. SMS9]MDP5459051.1 TDT family transporter [Alishewanella sp. SMS8]